MKRGEVWLTTLDPTVGAEIQKTRPCLIISPDDINRQSLMVMAAPLTSGSRPAPYRIEIAFRGVNGFVLPEQSRAVDRRRLIKRLGSVEASELADVLSVLRNFYTE